MRWLRSIFRRSELERELAAELAFHLEQQIDAKIAAGIAPEQARLDARREFGGLEQVKEECRDQRGAIWLEHFARDLRFAVRMLFRNKAFAATALLTLVLCIGANTAIFSMLYALVIRPLPFHEPERLVEIYNSFPKVGIPKLGSNRGQYLDFEHNAPAFAQLALSRVDDYTLGEDSGPSRLAGAIATAGIFDLLGVQPLLGRFFTPENHVPAADKVVVLTQSFWESHFQGDRGVIGRSLRLDGENFEIIGVAPRRFEAFNARVRFVRPLAWTPGEHFEHVGYSLFLYGRLRSTAGIGEAAAQVVSLEKQYYNGAAPGTRDFLDRTGHVMRVDTLQAQRAGPVKASLYLLQGGALVVLLIGCVNVANLTLARANARSGEFAMRLALGASGGAIARQLLVESALLGCLGSVGGLLFAWSGLTAANHFSAQLLPEALPFGLDRHALACTAITATALTLFVGLLPALYLHAGHRTSAAQIPGRGLSAGRRTQATGSALVVAQIAFAFVLLVGAGLLFRSFANVLAVKPGFDPQQMIGARIGVPLDKEKSFPPRLEAALREIPGVETALATATPFLMIAPYPTSMPLGAIHLRGYALPSELALPSVYYCGVTPSYFETMRIPLREGRWFVQSDMEKGRAVVVDARFAERYFAGRSAVGQHLVLNNDPPENDKDWLEIVGVAGEVRHNGVEDQSGQPFIYIPLTQTPFYGTMTVLLRTSRPVPEIVALLRAKVTAIDPALPVVAVEPMTDVISDSFANRRGILLLLASFAGAALLLSAVGIFGMLIYDVSRRTQEFGIRGALGATRQQILTLILRQGLWKTGAGLLLGFGGALGLSRFLKNLLFGVSPTDPLAYVVVSIPLFSVALLASYLPARRAARIDPAIALRNE